MRQPVLLAAIVAGSGFAGLAYEIVWTRILSTALGTDMMAVLGVVTGFFAGLAVGAFTLDPWLRRAADPRRAYAGLETMIALWAVASIWLLPASGDWLARLLGPAPPQALLWLAGFGMPALVLLPATTAMGGTLIVLERFVAPLDGNGRVVAGVYGANTLGATIGCLASVFLIMPALGLTGALLLLATVNAACALAAFALRPVPSVERRAGATLGRSRLLFTLAGTGLLGIALEILVIRLASQILQNTVYSFAVLLAAYLLGTAAGGLLWQRTRIAPSSRAIGTLLAGSALASCLTAVNVLWLGAAAPGADIIDELLVAGALFLLPAAIMGALFGCLAQAWRDRSGSLGLALGVNAAGAALAAPVASLLLIPLTGAVAGLLVIAAGFLLFSPRPLRAAIPAILILGIARFIPVDGLVRVPWQGSLLAHREGPTATASVVSDGTGSRYLEINGHFRMGGTGSLRSDWRQAQIPLLLHPAPHRALFLGVGTGATLAGAAAWPALHAIGVELVPEAVALLPWFAEPGAPPLPQTIIADARRFVRADTGAYDVIVADLFHPALDGSGALYTEQHFAAIRQRLAPGGVFCQWLPLYQLDASSLDAIIRAFLAVYPDASGWLDNFGLQTPMLALVGPTNRLDVDAAHLAPRLADPSTRAARQRTGLITPFDLLGLFVAGPATLRRLAGPGPRNTDDHPFVTFDAVGNVYALAAPPSTLLLQVLHRVSEPVDGDARLAAYRRARDAFIATGAAIDPGLDPRALMNAAIPGLLETLRLSPDFAPAYDPLVSMALSLMGPNADPGDLDAARRILQAARDAAPGRPEAELLLARLRPGDDAARAGPTRPRPGPSSSAPAPGTQGR